MRRFETDEGAGHEAVQKLSDGSTARMRFYEYNWDEAPRDNWIADIEIEVYRKRKHSDPRSKKVTGRVGLEAASFFLTTLTEYEAGCTPGTHINATGVDARRKQVYQRVLGKRGYVQTMDDGELAMVKIIK